jgi:hypothetical protein
LASRITSFALSFTVGSERQRIHGGYRQDNRARSSGSVDSQQPLGAVSFTRHELETSHVLQLPRAAPHGALW